MSFMFSSRLIRHPLRGSLVVRSCSATLLLFILKEATRRVIPRGGITLRYRATFVLLTPVFCALVPNPYFLLPTSHFLILPFSLAPPLAPPHIITSRAGKRCSLALPLLIWSCTQWRVQLHATPKWCLGPGEMGGGHEHSEIRTAVRASSDCRTHEPPSLFKLAPSTYPLR